MLLYKLNIMKKVLTIVLAMFFLAFCEKSNAQKNDLAELKLNGKVKSLKEILYEAMIKSGEVVKGDVLTNEQIIFNEKGNKLEENNFNPDGSLSSKHISPVVSF